MKIPATKGCYILIIELNTPTDIPIGRRGIYSFKEGYLAYIGSALNGLEPRIGRHLRKEKKLHWHIDYLLQHTELRRAIYAETDKKQECLISKEFLNTLEPVPGFGCSDCRCLTHLFYHEDPDALRQAVLTVFGNVKLTPVETTC